MEPSLKIEIGNSDSEKSYQVIKFSGEFDKAGHMEVRTDLDSIVNNFKLKTLVFDLSGLRFINSESIGYLMEIHAHLVKREKALVLVGADTHVKDVLKTIGISEVIPTYDALKDFLNKS